MLSDEQKKYRVKSSSDIPLNRCVLDKNREWVMYRSNNYYRMVVFTTMALQFVADICCLMLSFVRGLWTSWAINPLLIILACFGFFGAVRVEPISLLIHAIGCYIGLLIIIIGCADNYARFGDAIVWAMHAPGVVDLVCALMTTIMAASITHCGCGACCLHSQGSRDLEEGNRPSASAAPANNQPVSSADANGVEMEQPQSRNAPNDDDVNFDELDDDAKIAALQKKQQQQEQQKS